MSQEFENQIAEEIRNFLKSWGYLISISKLYLIIFSKSESPFWRIWTWETFFGRFRRLTKRRIRDLRNRRQNNQLSDHRLPKNI